MFPKYNHWRGCLVLLPLLFIHPAMAQQGGCFERIHPAATPHDAAYSFDLKFDRTAQGRSFSCDLGMRPSAVRNALDRFRSGILYDDEKDLNNSVRFPLTANVYRSLEVDERPTVLVLKNAAELLAFKKSYVSPMMLRMIACSSLLNAEIVLSRSYGVMLLDGGVWLHKAAGSSRVLVTSINIRPMRDEDLVRWCVGQ